MALTLVLRESSFFLFFFAFFFPLAAAAAVGVVPSPRQRYPHVRVRAAADVRRGHVPRADDVDVEPSGTSASW